MENIFYKKVNKNSYKEMFYFLKNHFQYYTMNSWNRLKSIANNVKIYNLELNSDYGKILEVLEADNYYTINLMIEHWEAEHSGYSVGFNGRSGGYLVLCNSDNNRSILDDYLDYENYNDFKEAIQDRYYGYGSLKNYKSKLIEQVELVQSFDMLCDDLRNKLEYMATNCTIKEEKYTEIKTRKVLERD